MRLIKDSVRSLALPPGKSEAIFFDDEQPGFGLRIREGGSRSWVFQYKIGTKQRRLALGKAPPGNLAAMRKTAEQLYHKVRLGEDPAGAKTHARAQAAQTFEAVAAEYLEMKRLTLRRRSYPDVERYLLKHAKTLHELQIAKIGRADIAAVIAAVIRNAGAVTANRVHTSLSGFFGWALEQGRLEANPVSAKKPHKETPRDRVLLPAELRLIWNALGDGDYADIVRLLALTGARAGEIGDLRWSEIADGAIVLPGSRTKNHRPHVIALSAPAAAILAGRKKRDARDLIFGRGEGGFSGWSNCKERLDERIAAANGGQAIPEWTVHDLRRSFATHCAGLPEHQLKKLPLRDRELAGGLGIDPHVIEACLNHVSGYKAGIAIQQIDLRSREEGRIRQMGRALDGDRRRPRKQRHLAAAGGVTWTRGKSSSAAFRKL